MTSLPYLDKFSKLTILIFGILIGAIISFILFVYLPSSGGDIHFVQSISSHYSKENENSETTLVVYLDGERGHVKKVLCRFSPDTVISKDTLKKVLIKGVSNKYMLGEVGYYCDKIE